MNNSIPTSVGDNTSSQSISFIAPDGPLSALENARTAVLSWQSEARTQFDAIHAELLAAQNGLAAASAELVRIREERDRWRNDCIRNEDSCRQMSAQLKTQAESNRHLRAGLMELYQDLRAGDLPTLILRISTSLTDAENGLYTEADGETITASIGMDDLPDESTAALCEFTRQALHDSEPVVRNEEQTLPDGSALANLAALPVAVQSARKGAILVANKATGPFTKEDTELLLSIGKHAGIALENNRLHRDLADAYLSTITVLADAIGAKDPYTRGHCESVADFAMRLARHMGWEGDSLEQIRYAALLHDVGKIGIPDGILLKPGRLLPDEFRVIQAHATIGSDLVGRVPSLEPIAPIIRHHHERVDGSGYPDGLKGDEILMGSRIVGVVDAFDAMTTPRPYREPVSPREALDELRRCAGTQFDGDVVALAAEVLGEIGMLNGTGGLNRIGEMNGDRVHAG